MLSFISGLFLFFLGLEASKKTLKLLSINWVEKTLKNLNNNLFLSIIIGIFITAIMQSSSAVTVITISLIEAKLLQLKAAIGIVLGANIGTTITVQIISLPVLAFYPYLILFGLSLVFLGFLWNKNLLTIGMIIGLFGIVFAGLNLMTVFFQNPTTNQFLNKTLAFAANNYFLGIILGMIVTSIVQSSSLVTSLTISLAYNNLITLPVAIAIALGSNIGTCFTGFLASINCQGFTKRLVWGHLLFNLIGVITILPILPFFTLLVKQTNTELIRQIANAHTLFNIYNLLIFLPFINTFISFLEGEYKWK